MKQIPTYRIAWKWDTDIRGTHKIYRIEHYCSTWWGGKWKVIDPNCVYRHLARAQECLDLRMRVHSISNSKWRGV